jgi:hypothetical protein
LQITPIIVLSINPKTGDLISKRLLLQIYFMGLLTLSLVVYHFSAVTVIGLGYFSIEISIIVLLAIVELRTAHHPNSN